jgi:hypothetical protein
MARNYVIGTIKTIFSYHIYASVEIRDYVRYMVSGGHSRCHRERLLLADGCLMQSAYTG